MGDPVSESARQLKEFWIPDYILNQDFQPEGCSSDIPECPVIVFVNSKSGGQLGGNLLETYRSLLNTNQVVDLLEQAPDKFLSTLYLNLENLKKKEDDLAIKIQEKLRLVVAGGDGTAGWILGVVCDLKLSHPPPIATMPLGTGNNLPFAFGWGKKNPGTDQPSVKSFLDQVMKAKEMKIDNWHILMRMKIPTEGNCEPIAPLELPHSLHAFHRVSPTDSSNMEGHLTFRGGFWNYFSMGMDAQVSYAFHSERKLNPEKFKNQLVNQSTYAKLGCTQGWFFASLFHPADKNIAQLAKVKIMKKPGGEWEEIHIPHSIRSIVCLNLPSFSGGLNPWGTPNKNKLRDRDLTPPYVDDGLIEVVGFRDAWHGLVLLAPNGHGTRLAQAKRIRFEFHKGATNHTFMRIDGEPWKQPLPVDDDAVVVEISHHGQVNMLATHECRAKSIRDPSSLHYSENEDDDNEDDSPAAAGENSAFIFSPKDIKDIFSGLKDSAAELNGCTDTSKYQITYGILFSLVIAFTSDALSTVPEKVSVLSRDVSFRQEFQDIVMAPVNDPNISGFVDCVRLAWSVHLMLVQEGVATRDTISSASSKDLQNISSCLEVIFSNNVFQFFMEKVLRTAAYQNDDEDMTYMYNAYLHKLMTIFLSEPLARDKVKEVKEKVMTTLSPYRMGGPHGFSHLDNINADHAAEVDRQPFISLLEFISEIYQKEPELLSGNDVLWTFVNFAGEDHSNFHTLVAFLKMLGALACSQEGSSKVFELLQGKTFRSVSWSTLFDCLSIYADKFKQTLQSTGSLLPEFPEGDAKALVAYLTVLRKVVENGNPIDRKNWFTDIEPLFKLLSYENVPPFLKGALRDAIAVFIQVSPLMKDTIWGYLEQYDLPVVVGPQVVNTAQPMSTQVYDMQFELNEIEARREYYPSTISFINLLNALIAEEKDFSDGGRRFVGIFRFIYDQVFGPFPQRAYADLSEKWQLVVACLHHFRMILTTYEITIEDIESVVDRSQLSTVQQPAQHQLHLPVVELMKDFMSGKTVFRNIMGILSPGVNAIITERTSQIYGDLLEKAVNLSLEIIILILGKDIQLADYWRPLYQPLDVILSQDHNQIVALLEYVRYDLQPLIQQCSIKIMSSLSSRMVGLVQLLLKYNAASSLVEDYASCLEIRAQESQIVDNSSDDLGVLILQLLIDNISRPAPNVTHLLLKFDLDTPIERTVLQPRFNYSCLKVILDMLDKFLKPDVNALLHEFEFQLLYELCVDELTSGPMMDLLSNKRYHFFVKHLETIGIAPLPKQNSAQALRTSSLHQRAWLLKLLTVELHSGDMTDSSHRETCRKILVYMFGQEMNELEGDHDIASSFALQNRENTGTGTISKSKALELLDIIQFRAPEATMDYSQVVSNTKCSMLAEEILRSSVSEKDGVYYYSERGDRLINLTSFRDKLWQMSSFGNELELNDFREMVQQLLRWAWKYNRNLEEQAAQLHMLTGWSQIVEISASRRLSSLENRTEVLFQLLDASISASASPDCSLKMALLLTQVALTCMAKLRDDRYLYPAGLNSDAVTCLDAIMFKQLSNGACLSILFKLTLALLRHDSSEALRRRQYALLLSYFQYCQHVLDPDVPKRMLQLLLGTNQDSEDMDLEKIDKEQEELARSNFSILRKEAQAILDLVIKDATQGSESGKTISHFVLDALICIDHEKFFLNQLQSRGFLRSCLMSISNFSHQDVRRTMETLQRACTLEAELALVLRISHKYGKAGAQVLSSMGTLENLASCKALYMPLKGSLRRAETRFGRELPANADKQQVIVAPVLRLVLSLTSLVDASEFFEVKNKIVREAIEFVKAHPSLFDRALQENIFEVDDLMMELINLSVGILSKVWPYEENDEFGFVQGLFRMMCDMFSQDSESFSSVSPGLSPLNQRRSELKKYHIGFRLSSYLYFQVTKKSLRLQVSDDQSAYHKFGGKQQPTLALLGHFLNTVTSALERAADEKSLLLNKIQDINELSRQEVDGIINTYTEKTRVSTSDNTNTRRYIAMVEMCQIVGDRDQLVTLLLLLAENVLNVILAHFQDTSLMAGTNDTTKLITCTSDVESKQDLSSLCGKLLPILERLELLNEDKIGQSLKVFGRLVTSLKELTIRKLAS